MCVQKSCKLYGHIYREYVRPKKLQLYGYISGALFASKKAAKSMEILVGYMCVQKSCKIHEHILAGHMCVQKRANPWTWQLKTFASKKAAKSFYLSNLDVSIWDTECWVVTADSILTLNCLCQQPTQRSVSPILTSKFDEKHLIL